LLAACARQPIEGLNDEARSRHIQDVLTTAGTHQLAALAAPGEDIVCFIYPAGGVIPGSNMNDRLLAVTTPWINSDAYWTLVFARSRDMSLSTVIGIKRSLVADISGDAAELPMLVN
jgi:hypothetical protein